MNTNSKRYLAIFLLLKLSFSLSAMVTVGQSPGFGTCDFISIQEAIDSGDNEIRILNNQDYIENLVINRTLDIRGGYNSCLAAQIGSVSSDKTTIRGSQILGSPVIEITTPSNAIPVPLVRLFDLIITDATDTPFVDGGRGIDIGNSSIFLSVIDTVIRNNTAENGGGIYINNPLNAAVYLTNSKIDFNQAEFNGGGIYCANNSTEITVNKDSSVTNNSSNDGGGIYAINGCQVDIYAGTDLVTESGEKGVISNHAANNGGGIYADFAAEIHLYGNINPLINQGNSTDPVTLAFNHANNKGGAIYADRLSRVELEDALIYKNTTDHIGGAIYISNQTELFIKKADKASCWRSNNHCSDLLKNSATHQGGALYATSQATIYINHTRISENDANQGGFLFIESNGTLATLKNNILYSHGQNGSGEYDDMSVMELADFAEIIIYHNSIVANDMAPSGAIFSASDDASLKIINSIINNESESILNSNGGTTTQSTCNLVNENTSFGGLLFQNELFIDQANNDFHLAENSEAIDLCISFNETIDDVNFDIDGEPRPYDDPLVDFFGPADAGADESYLSDIIFKNGLE